MNKYLVAVILGLTSAANAFQTPMQTSLNTISKLMENLKADSSLSLYSISKIHMHDNAVKVEFIDNRGNCKALAYELKRNELGSSKVQLMTDAIVICD
ncbi:MAG: hypothetical protein VX642_12465 [Bdellovibrionota bacterium]|nr:hypothetical protein [Bdellovibrionota bacterium]